MHNDRLGRSGRCPVKVKPGGECSTPLAIPSTNHYESTTNSYLTYKYASLDAPTKDDKTKAVKIQADFNEKETVIKSVETVIKSCRRSEIRVPYGSNQ